MLEHAGTWVCCQISRTFNSTLPSMDTLRAFNILANSCRGNFECIQLALDKSLPLPHRKPDLINLYI